LSQVFAELRNNTVSALVGLQEAVVFIADHVSQHVQKVKLGLAASELEKEIRSAQVYLGKKVYDRRNEPLESFKENPRVEQQILKIKALRKQLEANNAIVSPFEALHDFERLLIRSDFVIQQVWIPEGYHGIGKTISHLALPPQMLIFFIRKKSGLALAFGRVIIEAQDEVTFLCAKEDIADYISFWK